MASSKQAEYNRLRAELDKLKRENIGASQEMFGARHDAYLKKVRAIEAKIKAIVPPTGDVLFLDKAIMDAEERVRISKSGTPARVAALAELKRLKDTSGAQEAQQDTEKNYDTGYKKSVADAKEAKKKLKERSDTFAREKEAIAKWEAENEIRATDGLTPLPKPVFGDKPVDSVVKPGTTKTDLKTEEPLLGWAASVPMDGWIEGRTFKSPDEARLAPSESSTSQRKRMLMNDALNMFNDDPKIRKQVMSILDNAGVKVDAYGIVAFDEWQKAIETSNRLANSGKGFFVTPMEALKSMYGTSKGPTTTTNKSMVEYTSEHMGAIVDKIFQENLIKDPTPAQRNRYVAEFQKLAAQGNITTTTTTGGNSVSKTKYGFSEADQAAKLASTIKTSPEFAIDYKQRQALDFNDAFNRIMQGGL